VGDSLFMVYMAVADINSMYPALSSFLGDFCGPEIHVYAISLRIFRQVCFHLFVCLMVFNATFNNIAVISWRSVLLVEESGESHRPCCVLRILNLLLIYHQVDKS
jgi:hypothetical protein